MKQQKVDVPWLVRVFSLVILLLAGTYVEVLTMQKGGVDPTAILQWGILAVIALGIGQLADAFEDKFFRFKGTDELLRHVLQSVEQMRQETSSRHERDTEMIVRTIERVTAEKVEVISGYDNVYTTASRAIRKASERIWGTTLSTWGTEPEYFREVLKEKVTKDQVEHKVVWGITARMDIEALQKSLEHASGMPTRLISYIETKWEMDLLIVDDMELIIAFPVREAQPRLEGGIRITDRVAINTVAEWYQNYLWRRAISLKDATGIRQQEWAKVRAKLMTDA